MAINRILRVTVTLTGDNEF
uniref:Uncharacterized protein n=1 Tax=Rhizophora mucronata TaxID=61149 RepID=A0A2P2ITE9_RHIMU